MTWLDKIVIPPHAGIQSLHQFKRPWTPAFAGVTLITLLIFPQTTQSFFDFKSSENIRRSALAGSWYLKDPDELKLRLNLYLDRVGEPTLKEKPVALISPHAGYRYSGQAAAYGYKALKGQGIKRVILMGLSHQHPFQGASIPDVTHYETPLGKVPLDLKAKEKLLAQPLFQSLSQVHKSEHSVEIQIPFLQMVLEENWFLVPIVFGHLEDADFAKAADAIRPFIDENTIVIASSDFVHYGNRFQYTPFIDNIPINIKKTDGIAIEYIIQKDFHGYRSYLKKSRATICGRTPISVLLKLLPDAARGSMLRYYRSGDITGDWNNSVSYASILFTSGNTGRLSGPVITFKGSERNRRKEEILNNEEQQELLILARKTVESYVRDKKPPNLKKDLPDHLEGLNKSLGVFVTLKKHGQLRGCIGDIMGTRPLNQGTVFNAIQSCSRDPRFNPVAPEELKDIHIEISVLSKPQLIDSVDEILPGWHGVIFQKGDYQSVYLPQVALETGWERDEMLNHLSAKAGLSPTAWKHGARFFIFEAQIFSE